MEQTITYNNQDIPYRIRKSTRAKRLSLSVHCDGGVVLTVPRLVSEKAAGKFLNEKASWIVDKLAYYKQFEDISLATLGKKDYTRYKQAAYELAVERMEYFTAVYAHSYNSISIKNQKTCWGSCTSKGNVSFNYKIVFLSPELRDYVIVHELCHLKELNHSKRFWDLVSIAVPNHKELRNQLRKIL